MGYVSEFFMLTINRSSFHFRVKANGFPGGTRAKEHKRRGFDPWVGKSPWRRA